MASVTTIYCDINQWMEECVMLKSITVVMLLMTSICYSQSESVFRSVAIPGWGQYYNEQPTKGLIIVGSEIGLFGSYLLFSRLQNNNYNDYLDSEIPKDVDAYYKKANTYRVLKNTSAGVAGIVWAFSIYDAWRNYEEPKNYGHNTTGLKTIFQSDAVHLAYTIRLGGQK